MTLPMYFIEVLGTSRKAYWRLRSRNGKVLAVSETMSRRNAIEVCRRLGWLHEIDVFKGDMLAVAKNAKKRGKRK